MTTGFSKARFELMRAIATREPDISVKAPPLIDTLVRERLVAYDGVTPILAGDGPALYARWSREQALGDLPGVTVRHAQRARRCIAADEITSWVVTTWLPDGSTTSEVSGAGARTWIDSLSPTSTTVEPIINEDYSPDCLGDIPAGAPFVEHHSCATARRTARFLCIRCAFRILEPQPKETDHARPR